MNLMLAWAKSTSGVSAKIYVETTAKADDVVKSPNGDVWVVIALDESTRPKIPEYEQVLAKDLIKGDELWHQNEWCTVENNYLHHASPYAKLSVTPESKADEYRIQRISGLSFELGLNDKVRRKTKEYQMSIYLINANKLVTELSRKLGDFTALQHAPARVEVVPSVFVDKEVLMNTLRTDIKAVQNKLAEKIKKL